VLRRIRRRTVCRIGIVENSAVVICRAAGSNSLGATQGAAGREHLRAHEPVSLKNAIFFTDECSAVFSA